MDERRLGVVSGLSAYVLWGLFPLYFPLLEPAGGLEIVAHRVLWSLLFVGILLTALRRWAHVRALQAFRPAGAMRPSQRLSYQNRRLPVISRRSTPSSSVRQVCFDVDQRPS